MTANPQPTITIPELTPFLRANQFPMSPQSPLPVQIQAFLPRPPALPPATRLKLAPKAVTTTPSRLTKSALQRVTTDTLAIPVAAIKLVPTMATILPFLPEKPVPPFIPAPV